MAMVPPVAGDSEQAVNTQSSFARFQYRPCLGANFIHHAALLSSANNTPGGRQRVASWRTPIHQLIVVVRRMNIIQSIRAYAYVVQHADYEYEDTSHETNFVPVSDQLQLQCLKRHAAKLCGDQSSFLQRQGPFKLGTVP